MYNESRMEKRRPQAGLLREDDGSTPRRPKARPLGELEADGVQIVRGSALQKEAKEKRTKDARPVDIALSAVLSELRKAVAEVLPDDPAYPIAAEVLFQENDRKLSRTVAEIRAFRDLYPTLFSCADHLSWGPHFCDQHVWLGPILGRLQEKPINLGILMAHRHLWRTAISEIEIAKTTWSAHLNDLEDEKILDENQDCPKVIATGRKVLDLAGEAQGLLQYQYTYSERVARTWLLVTSKPIVKKVAPVATRAKPQPSANVCSPVEHRPAVVFDAEAIGESWKQFFLKGKSTSSAGAQLTIRTAGEVPEEIGPTQAGSNEFSVLEIYNLVSRTNSVVEAQQRRIKELEDHVSRLQSDVAQNRLLLARYEKESRARERPNNDGVLGG